MLKRFSIYFLLFMSILFILLSSSFAHNIEELTQPSWPFISDYGPRNHTSYWHGGLDYDGNAGDLIYPVEGGTVSVITFDTRGGGYYIGIRGAHGQFNYLHTFSDGSLPRRSGNLELRYTENNQMAIIFYTDSTLKVSNRAICAVAGEKIKNNSGKYIKNSNNQDLLTISNVGITMPIAPVGTSGGVGSHLHLGRPSGIDNALLWLVHTQSSFNMTFIEPTNNSYITQGNKRINVEINSTNGLDLDKVDFYLNTILEYPKIDDSHRLIRFQYGGRPGEDRLYADRSNGTSTGINPIENGRDSFIYNDWNSKVSKLGSGTAISCLDAKFPDGEYKLIVRTEDINQNEVNSGRNENENIAITFNNWTPQIKSLTTNATSEKPLKAGDTIEIKIEFTEQMNTGKIPTVQIWDAKASQWKGLSLSGIVWSNSADGRIKEALLKASATLPDWGETGQGTTQELKVKVTGAYGKGADNDVIKTEHAEKDASGNDLKITADLYVPKANDGSVVPQETNADEPQQVHVGVNLEDNESGFTPGEQVNINVEGVGTVTGQVDANGTVQANFQSPVVEGSYPVTVEAPKDKAGNESKEKKKKVGTLKVTKNPKSDNSSNPDESLDVFDPSLTGNKATRFGAAKVAIYKSGYAVELSDLLATFGEAADFIPPENFSPAYASTYPILIIPSAGLANQTNSANLRGKLTEYVENGGNLIVMTQPTDECYQLLPDKVESLGYFQDKACYYSTAGIKKYTPALAGQPNTTIDGTADGVIISWPDNAETWLYRLKNNFPALISYQYGKGRVVVSNYYSDYAHGHSQLNQDEKALMRDLLSWGRDFRELSEVKPGGSLPINVPVSYRTGGTEGTVTQVRLILRNPNRKSVVTKEVPLEIAAGGTGTVSYDFNDADQSLSKNALGIWWINYELLDTGGNVVQAEREGQRVALSKGLTGTAQNNIAVTVDSSATTALEGTSIPFRVIARNDGDTGRTLTLKVYAVLYTLVSQVQEETQVYSESISVNPHDKVEITTELLPFKAYTSTGGYSWDKNWWRFVFTDENGKEIVAESRGISVYRPAAKVNYKFRNLTSLNALVFKPGDQICLDLTIENMVPVGYPVEWKIQVKAKSQNQVVYEQTGNATLDPVITPYQVFTIPDTLQSDTYKVELEVKHNGVVIPLVFGESKISTQEKSNLKIDNYVISLNGLTMDLTNPNNSYTDYTILTRVYDESNKLVAEDYQSGGVYRDSTVKIDIPYSGFVPSNRYRVQGFYLTYPTTHGNWFYHTIEPGQGSLQLTVNSVVQESDSKKLYYNLEIENSGFESSDVQLRAFIKGINYSQKVSLPNLKTGEKTSLAVEIPLPNGLEQGVYPVEFAFCYVNETEVLAYRHYPQISLEDLKVSGDGVVCNMANTGILNSDFKFSYKIYKSGTVVGEGELSGLLAASETKQFTIPVSQFNPFNSYQVVGNLFYPSSGQEQEINQKIEPFKVELEAPKEQTIVDNKFPYELALRNVGPEISNLQLSISLAKPALQHKLDITAVATGAICEFKGELELPEDMVPGTYNVTYHLLNTNGDRFYLGSGRYTILTPQIAVNAPVKTEFVPGDSYGIYIVNTGGFTTKVNYEYQIKDGTGTVVATQQSSVDLGPNQENNLIVPIDGNWTSSHYFANWKLTTSPIQTSITGYKAFSVKGAETGFTVATDQSIYRPDQSVIAKAQLVNGNYPVSGNLELSISGLTTSGIGQRIDGWHCVGGNNQRTGLSKLSGAITTPSVLWSSQLNVQDIGPLVGDLNGDGLNEVVFPGGTEISIHDGVSGFKKQGFEYINIYPAFQKVTGALLADIDNNGSQEVIVCLDNCFLVAFNAKLEVVWFKELTEPTMNSDHMTVADFNGDCRPELLLEGLLLDAGSREVIRTGIPLGTVGDLNGDGKVEIVTQTVILDNQFQTVAVRSGGTTFDQFPILADLNHDGLMEILVAGPNNLNVYNYKYEPYWSVPIGNIHKVTVGDLDGDGYQEVISARLIRTPSESGLSFEINCYSNSGSQIWQKTESIEYQYVTKAEIGDMVLNDVDGNSRLELITANYWSGITAYNAGNGEALWNFIDRAKPEIVIADIDGDRESEAIVYQSSTYISIDNIGTVCRQEPRIITAPLEKTDKYLSYRTFDTNPSQLFKLANGTLLTPGNQCISYYVPSANQTGVIPFPGTNPRCLAFRETKTGVEVWDYQDSVLLGLLNPDTLQYTAKNIKKDFCHIYSPSLIRDNWYYYKADGEILAQNLDTGAVRSFGILNPSFNLLNIVAVLDDSNLLVIVNNYLSKLSLVDLTIITLAQQPFTNGYRDALWLDENLLILKGASGGSYNDGLYQFNLLDNTLTRLITLEELRSSINDDEIVPACNLEFAVRDSNNLYLTLEVDELRSQYFNADYRYQPALYNFNLINGTLTKLTTFKEFGPLGGLTQTGGKVYFMLSHPANGVYYYDQSSGITINYPLPDIIYRKIVDGRLNHISKMFAASDGKVGLWLESNVYIFDPGSGSWNETSLNLGSNVYPFDMCFGSSSDLLYILASVYNIELQHKLISYNLSSRSITELDTVNYNSYFENLFYDSSTRRLFYTLANQAKYMESDTGEITELCELSSDETVMVNAKGDKIYFMYVPITLNTSPEYSNLNLWEYSLNEDKFAFLSSVSKIDYEAIFEYSGNFYGINLDGFTINSDSLKFYAATSDKVLEFNLAKVEVPISDNNIYDGAGSVYTEKTIAWKTLPVNLTTGESQNFITDFEPITEPGTYTLKGQLTNTLGQELAQDQKQFVVSDNGLGLSVAGDKQYYRPNENITLSGLLFNTTEIASGSLKFTIAKIVNGQTSVVQEEELTLNAGEQRPYTLYFIESLAGEYMIEAKLTQNGTVVAQAKLLATVAEPQVEVELDVPSVIGSKPVSALIKLINKSPYPVSVYAASELLQLAESVTLGANETVVFTKEFSLTGDAILLFNITGDVTVDYQRTVIFNEKADLAVTLPAQVPESTQSIAYYLSNTGSVSAELPIGFTLYRDGALVAQYSAEVLLNPSREIAGEWPVALTSGSYRLVYTTLNQTKELNFTCLPDYAATLTATSELAGLDELKVNINAVNTGCNPILGVINLESDFTEQSIPVEISSGVEFADELTITGLPAIAGTYELKISLEAMGIVLATQTVNFTREEMISPAPKMGLAVLPENLTGGAGQELPVTVKVKNSGDVTGDCIVELNSEAVTFSDSTVINLTPGAEAEYTFKMPIPDEMESGTYQGQIIVNETVTSFQYQVNGYKLEAVASLDKAAYLNGETAVLTIAVQNKGGQANIPLTVRVKQGDFDDTREINLGSSTNLTYQIPVTDFNQKIFYGFYHSGTGRSLLLDVHNIYEAVSEFTAVPDKQRYQAGETVNFNVQVNQEGWLAVAGPNDFYSFESVKESKSYAIPLPSSLKTGTYSVWAAFAGKTLEYKIDVVGQNIRFASGKMDQTVYQNGEPFQLDIVVTSEENLTCSALVELVKPDGTSQSISSNEVNLTTGENSLSFKGIIKSDQIGTHQLRVQFQSGDLTVSRNDFSFQFGEEELLGITCSKAEYLNGTEPVSGEVHLYGQGGGSVGVFLDGQAVTTLSAQVNGNTVVPYNIPASYLKPGSYTLSAIYSGSGGQSGTVKTQFTYGSNLPDLTVSKVVIGKERGSDGSLPITVAVQKGNILPAKDIKVEVTLDNELIGEYVIPELSGENAIDSRIILWQVGTFYGDAELKVTVNCDNRVYEYINTNNTVIAKVVIPMVPQVSGLPALANDPRLAITGQTTPNVLVCLYDSKGMIDFGYADGSGNFNLTDHCLYQGENSLRLKARSRDGMESLFSEVITVILDAIPPQISVYNLGDGQHFNYDVLPEISIDELNPAKFEYTLNGQAWIPGTPITTEGQHQLCILVTDVAGNRSELNLNFTIDKTSPEVEITGLVDGGYYNTPQTPAVIVSDLNPVTTEMTLNGEPYQGATISEDWTYLFEVLAYDKAGNTVTKQVGFTIDQTKPVIQISGVTDGETYRKVVVPVVSVIEANPAEETVLLDGQPFISGTAVKTEGNHELSVTAVDKAGNQETIVVKFTLTEIPKESGRGYNIFCERLEIRGDLKSDKVFCNSEFSYTSGDVLLGYLGITGNPAPNDSHLRIRKLEAGLTPKLFAEPDWEALTKANTLINKNAFAPRRVLENISVEGDLTLHGKPILRGVLVVKGNLTIAKDTKLGNSAIFCTGKVTIEGNSQMAGLLYAGEEIQINGDFKLTGRMMTENMLIYHDTMVIGGNTDQYDKWFSGREHKMRKPGHHFDQRPGSNPERRVDEPDQQRPHPKKAN